MAENTNKYLASEKKGIEKLGDYAGAANDAARVQVLIDLLLPEHTTTNRGILDNISPQTHKQLLVELDALKATVS